MKVFQFEMTSRRKAPKLAFPTDIQIYNPRLGAHSSFAIRRKEPLNQPQSESPKDKIAIPKTESITAITSDGSFPKKLITSNSSEFTSFEYDEDKYNLNYKDSEQSFSYLSDVSDENESSLLSPTNSPTVSLTVPPFSQPNINYDIQQREKKNQLNTELDEYYKKSIYVLNEDEESKEFADQLTEFDINDIWLDSIAMEIFEKDYPEFLENLQDEIEYNAYTSKLAASITDKVIKDQETAELLRENPINASFKSALAKQRDKALDEEDYEKEMASLYKFNSQNYSAEELNQQWGFKNPQIGKYIAKYRKQLFVPS